MSGAVVGGGTWVDEDAFHVKLYKVALYRG